MSKKKRPDSPSEEASFNPRSMERMMRDMTKLLDEQEFESVEEANTFLDQFTGTPLPEQPPDDDPLAQAQERVYDAYDAPSRKEAVALAREALEISPDCADAYVLLAEADARSPEKARGYYEKGVAAGERALGPEPFEEAAGHFWGLFETRPYMRARQGLAQTLWTLGEADEAITHYRELLHLNPDDNQGNRYLLADGLLAAGRDDELEALLDRYEGDGSANWLYNRALLHYRQQDELDGEGSEQADAALEEALEQNPHVPAYLLGKKKLPKEGPAFVGFGDENEALDYARPGKALWRNTYGALRWLSRYTKARRRS